MAHPTHGRTLGCKGPRLANGLLRRSLSGRRLLVVRRSLSFAATVAAVPLLLIACANSSAAVPTLTTDAPLNYDSRGDYAGVFGVVHTERDGSAFCVWVDSVAGVVRGRVNLIFPTGYSATPAGEVVDPGGAVVVSEGKKVAVSVMPALTDKLPGGCSAAGAGTARALHVVQDE